MTALSVMPPDLQLQASCHVGKVYRVETMLARAADLGLTLPERLRDACAKRQAEFLAGRLCAAEAMATLTGTRLRVPINGDGSPAWPAGLIGSITHTDGYAAAAAARASDVLGLGLDAHGLLSAEAWEGIRDLIVLPRESPLQAASGLPPNAFHALVFSAKESVFKCLYPQVRRFFGFHDVAITEIAVAARRFGFRLLVDLGGSFRRGFASPGSFYFEENRVHTAVELLPADMPRTDSRSSRPE
jgi:enterobactin synthetase component D